MKDMFLIKIQVHPPNPRKNDSYPGKEFPNPTDQ